MKAKTRFFKFLCVVLLGLVVYDGLADLAGYQDSQVAQSSNCHESCGPHIVPRGPSHTVVVAPPKIIVPDSFVTPPLLLQHSIFHPPRLSA